MTVEPNTIAAKDIESLIHPYTNLDTFRENGPTIFERGKGIYVWDANGKQYIEGMSGLWCTALGFGEEELAKAKAKLEWAKEKVSVPTGLFGTLESISAESVKRYKDVVQSDFWREDSKAQNTYSTGLQRWDDLILKIDSALSSLPIEEETAIIEHYLSFINEKLSVEAGSESLKASLSTCQQRLGSISERWTEIRRSRIERVMSLEIEAANAKDEIKEAEVRFSVGEIEQEPFERNMSVLQATLKRVEKEISEIRSFIDDMDMKIFRCAELSGASR